MTRRVTLDEAVQILKEGGVLIYPTETSYALGCDATNDAAVARVFAVKGRPEGKGTPLILPPDADAAAFIDMSDRACELADKYWPGPLNIVARRMSTSPVSVRCETDGSQSVRKSSSAIASDLAMRLGRPIVATSANRSGETAIYKPSEVVDLAADALVDAGDLPIVPASTTVKIEGDKVEVLRQGAIVLSHPEATNPSPSFRMD